MRYGVYVISRSRYDCCLTARALEKMGVKYTLAVYPDEEKLYRERFPNTDIVVFDQECYERQYDTCDDLGLSVPPGSGPIRNFVWDTSISRGERWHLILDDNIEAFIRWKNGRHEIALDNKFFDEMMSFVEYINADNLGLFGCQYSMFAPELMARPPFIKNTRIFSAIFIRNDLPLRWKGRFNEDVILSVETLRLGYSTLLFSTHLCKKIRTQVLNGGNTTHLYSKTGTLEKSAILTRLYPDIAEVVYKYKRPHHKIDLSVWRGNKLSLNRDYSITDLHKIWNEVVFEFTPTDRIKAVITFTSSVELEKFLRANGYTGEMPRSATFSGYYFDDIGVVSARKGKQIYFQRRQSAVYEDTEKSEKSSEKSLDKEEVKIC